MMGTTSTELSMVRAAQPLPQVPTARLQEVDATGVPLVVGGTWHLVGDDIIVGRARDALVQIRTDAQVSRHHLRLVRKERAWVVEDLGSTHGTHVHGERIVRRVLEPGDEIRLGQTVLRFEA